jgi:hypothetical protein
MQIVKTTTPMQYLWDLLKSLYITDKIPIYKETMHEDDNSIPDSYILLRSQVSDTSGGFGDGKCLFRSADCDIILVSKGYADDSKDAHNVNKAKIMAVLNANEIPYTVVDFGFDMTAKNTQTTFSIEVNYIG